jgi:hypothetical protein
MQAKLHEFDEHSKTARRDWSRPLVSSVNSLHFENSQDTFGSVSASGTWFRLNEKLTSYKAQTVTSPFEAFEALEGVGVWHWDKEHPDKVMLYYGVGLQARLSDRSEQNSVIYAGSADGEASKSVTVDPWYIPPPFWVAPISKLLSWIPNDPGYFFKGVGDLCPGEFQAAVKQEMEGADLPDLVRQTFKGLSEAQDGHGPHRFTRLLQYMGQNWMPNLNWMTQLADCSTLFLRPDDPESTEWNVYSASAFVHTLFQVPTSQLLNVLSDKNWHAVKASLATQL